MDEKSDYTVSNDWMKVNNELGKMWLEVDTEETDRKPQSHESFLAQT
jgi:hypothetical protein